MELRETSQCVGYVVCERACERVCGAVGGGGVRKGKGAQMSSDKVKSG